jgi:hypothetical protein
LNIQLKAQIIQAVPVIYISTVQHPVFKFTNVSIKRILTFLKDNYGEISTDDLGTNQEKLMAPWDPNTPIQNDFTTGDDCRHFAAARGEPISDPMYIRYLLQKFQSSGVFAKAVTDWKNKTEADKNSREVHGTLPPKPTARDTKTTRASREH